MHIRDVSVQVWIIISFRNFSCLCICWVSINLKDSFNRFDDVFFKIGQKFTVPWIIIAFRGMNGSIWKLTKSITVSHSNIVVSFVQKVGNFVKKNILEYSVSTMCLCWVSNPQREHIACLIVEKCTSSVQILEIELQKNFMLQLTVAFVHQVLRS